MATFGPGGPERCSGLQVARYDCPSLHAVFGEEFNVLHCVEEYHRTPWGAIQQFI